MAEGYLAKDFLKNFQNLRAWYSFIKYQELVPARNCAGDMYSQEKDRRAFTIWCHTVPGWEGGKEAPEGRILLCPRSCHRSGDRSMTGTLSTHNSFEAYITSSHARSHRRKSGENSGFGFTGVMSKTHVGCMVGRVPIREQICSKQQETQCLNTSEPMWQRMQACLQVSRELLNSLSICGDCASSTTGQEKHSNISHDSDY